MPNKTALQKAADIMGSKRKLALELGVTRQAISQWRKVPAARCIKIEQLTGVSRHELRPDIYGEQPWRI
jgi:DNA-binding transcriptional regulator YdaS (Cro superfamily)